MRLGAPPIGLLMKLSNASRLLGSVRSRSARMSARLPIRPALSVRFFRAGDSLPVAPVSWPLIVPDAMTVALVGWPSLPTVTASWTSPSPSAWPPSVLQDLAAQLAVGGDLEVQGGLAGARVVATADGRADLALGLARQRSRAALGVAEEAHAALEPEDVGRRDRAILVDAEDVAADAGDRVGVERRVASVVADDVDEVVGLLLAVELPRHRAVAVDLDAALGVGALAGLRGARVDARSRRPPASRTRGRSRRRPRP